MRFPLSLALPCLLLAACANDIRVTADWDPATADLAAKKTFALGQDVGKIVPGRSVELAAPPYRDRVNRAITGELLASGRAEAAPGQAQLVVAWNAASRTVEETDTVTYRDAGFRDDPWRMRHYETQTWRHEEQTLSVTLSGRDGKVLWTGSVTAPEVADASPDDREKRVRELVRRLLAKLPKPTN